MYLGGIVMFPQYLANFGRNDAIASQRHDADAERYFFSRKKGTLQRGRVSVTHYLCATYRHSDVSDGAWDLNRRLRCPRASRQSSHSVSLPSSQLAVASRKKKLLLLSRSKQSRFPTNSKLSAGRAVSAAPQIQRIPRAFRGATC